MIQYFRKSETIQSFVLSTHPFIITLLLVLVSKQVTTQLQCFQIKEEKKHLN